MLRGVIFLVYYQRPRLVHNALQSIRNLNFPRDMFEVHAIDDGSQDPLQPIVERDFPDIAPLFTFYRCDDTPEQKRVQGGSRFGSYLNLAINLSIGEFGVTLCDDDALFPDYFTQLSNWFESNPHNIYGYCHVADYDPLVTAPGPHIPNHGTTNLVGGINGYCRVDGSQCAWRLSASRGRGGVKFPAHKTHSLDAAFYQDMYDRYGPMPFMGFFGQYKARGNHQLMLRPRGREYELTE